MKNRESNSSALVVMSFIAFIIIAVLEVISGIKSLGLDLFGPTIMNILNTIKNVCVIFVIGINAYRFVENKTKGWKIVYFVALLIFIVATVFMWI